MEERGDPSNEELRRRLESSAPLLEATRTRYRALLPALCAWGWRQRLRAVADIAREVARTDEPVALALHRALRRAEAEAWPEGPVLELLEEVSKQRAELLRLVLRRLGSEEEPGPGLAALLGQVVGEPRKVPTSEREAAAQEALQIDPSLIPALQHFGAAVEAVFSRSIMRERRLPFTLAEYDALLALWPEGMRVLTKAWAEIERIDTTGGVERELRRRSLRGTPIDRRCPPGPRALVHAAFWQSAAEAEVQVLIEERFAPISVQASERIEALRWLLAREIDGAARLPTASPRAALLMLAHELTGNPSGRAPLNGGRTQVAAWAAQADRLEGDDDWRRLRDGMRALGSPNLRAALPPIYRAGKSVQRAALPERLTDFLK